MRREVQERVLRAPKEKKGWRLRSGVQEGRRKTGQGWSGEGTQILETK